MGLAVGNRRHGFHNHKSLPGPHAGSFSDKHFDDFHMVIRFE